MNNTTLPDGRGGTRTAVYFTAVTLVVALLVVLSAWLAGQLGLLRFDRGAGSAEVRQVAVAAENYRYSQETLRVSVGERVELALVNYDRTAHSFDVDEFGVHVSMPQQKDATAAFTPNRAGSYVIYCGVPGHREAGMVSTLIVEP